MFKVLVFDSQGISGKRTEVLDTTQQSDKCPALRPTCKDDEMETSPSTRHAAKEMEIGQSTRHTISSKRASNVTLNESKKLKTSTSSRGSSLSEAWNRMVQESKYSQIECRVNILRNGVRRKEKIPRLCVMIKEIDKTEIDAGGIFCDETGMPSINSGTIKGSIHEQVLAKYERWLFPGAVLDLFEAFGFKIGFIVPAINLLCLSQCYVKKHCHHLPH
jgi:hypothetical protein